MQFLLEGAKANEKGVYIALEEQQEELEQNMSQFGWDLRNIKIIGTTQELSTGIWTFKVDSVMSKPEFTLSNLIGILQGKITNYKPKRIVIDSLTSVKMMYEENISARKEILTLMNFLSHSGCTTLLTSESLDSEQTFMEEFLCSGVIKIHSIQKEGEKVSAISVEKLRGAGFDRHIRPMKITSRGIEVFPNETVFSQ